MTLQVRVRAVAVRLCSARAMERLVDPVLTDIEIEYRTAIAEGRRWRSRWVRIAGLCALLKVVAFYACDRTAGDWSADDARALARTVSISAIAFVVAAVLLIFPAARPPSAAAHLLLYLIPQALPIAIPFGVTWGIVCGLGGRVVAPRVKAAIVVLAFAGSAGSLATMLWIMPAANQAYRVSVLERLSPQGTPVTLRPGPNEMPIGELRRRVNSQALSGSARLERSWAWGYYLRWSLPWAPLALALFALGLTSRLPFRGWILAGAACGAYFAYYLLLFAAEASARHTELPVVAVAWLPNLVFAFASIALMAASMKSRLSSSS